ncbi:hypothetical protein GINT2_001292 [Glugoides intestinalis]
MNDSDKQEEQRLLNILRSVDSELQLYAFKRLVRIYKYAPESNSIYDFIAEYEHKDSRKTNFLLELIFELINNPENSQKRIENIYNSCRIQKKFLLILANEETQINILVLLSLIFQSKPCNKEFARCIVETFCTTNRELVERLSGRIVLNLINSNFVFELNLIKHIQLKLHTTIFEVTPIVFEVKKAWLNAHELTVSQYLLFIEKCDLAQLLRLVNQDFLINNHREIENQARIIGKAYIIALKKYKNSKFILLEHFLLVVEHCNALREELKDPETVEFLYKLSECTCKDTSYIATRILSKVFENSFE